jgi:protoheme IX farnesyltransferase
MSQLITPQAVAKSASVEHPTSGVDRTFTAIASRLSDYLELTKPRIVVLELIVAAAAACLAARHALDLPAVLHALGATALVAASASIANQWLERRTDARMRRTANRPLPAGRVTGAEAVALSAVALGMGVPWLAYQVNLTTAVLGLASWMIYVAIYTPLKTRSPVNTTVGAIAGD